MYRIRRFGVMKTATVVAVMYMLIVGVSLHGLWSTKDGGKSWHQLGASSDSVTLTNRASAIIYDPKDATHFWESGIYNSFGVYFSDDDGVTLKNLGDAHHIDLVSIDFSDKDRKTLLAGQHE